MHNYSPTDFGQTLDCCNGSDIPDDSPSSSPGQSCNDNTECAALGLEGNCCPTNVDSVYLDCCDEISFSQDGVTGLSNEITKTLGGEVTTQEEQEEAALRDTFSASKIVKGSSDATTSKMFTPGLLSVIMVMHHILG